MPIIRPRIRRLANVHTPTDTCRRVDLSDNDFSALCMALDSATGRSFPMPVCRFVGENFATAIIKYRIRSTVPGHARRVTRYLVTTRILVNHGGNTESSDHPIYRCRTLRDARAHLRTIHEAFGVRTSYRLSAAAVRRASVFPRDVDVDDARCAVCGAHSAIVSDSGLCERCARDGRNAATGEL